ncbi:uncharacterized protein K02A2.6-like [Armigeres subalbatus]|uniref:uncharacterized protein K02A2.6-like n=1 Tax=Armigeres subalbatus TaxID=124917 RepID=UPI002ED53DCF
MASKRYDNGVAIAPNKKKKISKLDAAMRDLSEANSSNVLLTEELEKAHETIRSLQFSLSSARSEFEEVNSVEFENNLGPSSTKNHRNEPAVEMTQFMSTMNQMTISSINVPECKPSAEGEDISRLDYDAWQDLLVNSLALAGVTDEMTKFVVFKNLQVRLQNEAIQPFSNAMHRLKSYFFASTSDIMLQRRKLALMAQQPSESDLAFIRRIMLVARQCDYPEEKQFEEVLSTVAEQAKHKEIRIAALKMMSRKASLSELIDKVREIETIRLNEEYVAKKQVVTEPLTASVNAVRATAEGQYVTFLATQPQHMVEPHTNEQIFVEDEDKGLSEEHFYHAAEQCFAIKMTCHNCGGVGHLLRACNLPVAARNGRLHDDRNQNEDTLEVDAVAKLEDKKEDENVKESIPESSINSRMVTALGTEHESLDNGVIQATVAGMPCDFLIDSGAQVNTMTESTFQRLVGNVEYSNGLHNIQQGTDRPLKAYATTEGIQVLCTFEAFLHISDNRPVFLEKFYVVREMRSLLGRSTATRYSVLLLVLKVPLSIPTFEKDNYNNWNRVAFVNNGGPFPKFNIPAVRINYDTTIPPCRNIYMNVPAAMKEAVDQRLKELTAADIIERVTDNMDTKFCSSMLVVPKGPHDFRLVVDLRGPNRYIVRSPYAMPSLEKILARLKDAKWFSRIDLSSAFFHIELDERSRHLTNFMTEFGVYRYKRLPFGLCNSPDIFQEVMERTILDGCEGVCNYLDDVLVFGGTKEEHDRNLSKVQERLRDHNVEVNHTKCIFGSQEVTFIGFELTSDGWRIDQDKINAIKNFRRPKSCAEVKKFPWSDNFVDKFLIDRATKTEHLRALANATRFY